MNPLIHTHRPHGSPGSQRQPVHAQGKEKTPIQTPYIKASLPEVGWRYVFLPNTTMSIFIIQTTPSGSPTADSNFGSWVSPGPSQGHASPSPRAFGPFFFFVHTTIWEAEHISELPFGNQGSRNQKSSRAFPARGREEPPLRLHPLFQTPSPTPIPSLDPIPCVPAPEWVGREIPSSAARRDNPSPRCH